MIPVVTPAEMAAIDADAPEPVTTLIERAGSAVAAEALRLLGGGYGRRVLVIAGKGNNGNDGRVAARRLAARGARVRIMGPAEQPPSGPPVDLIIDAAFGTGLRGGWTAPEVGPAPVLAVDIPSGINGLTGQIGGEEDPVTGPAGRVLPATATVTFAGLKPGLLLGAGRRAAGQITVADIGLDCGRVRVGLVTAVDLVNWLPSRPADSHKWKAACWVVAGSPTMAGASHLCVAAAQRAGAGYVRLSSPGLASSPGAPTEAVYWPLPAEGWAESVLGSAERFRSLVVGPGLGRSGPGEVEIRRLVAAWDGPLVVDGDGLSALGERAGFIMGSRRVAAVLTPHDGEFERLTGQRPGPDRIEEARRLAAATGAVVLLKGPTTIVADPAGRVGLSLAGDARLATAGTGDVLAGIIGALLAQGLGPWHAALAGAELHGLAAARRAPRGLVASDLMAGLTAVLNEGATVPTAAGRYRHPDHGPNVQSHPGTDAGDRPYPGSHGDGAPAGPAGGWPTAGFQLRRRWFGGPGGPGGANPHRWEPA